MKLKFKFIVSLQIIVFFTLFCVWVFSVIVGDRFYFETFPIIMGLVLVVSVFVVFIVDPILSNYLNL